jgi:tRNA threonylcarbamoyladenosine biosynthesis protein TsaB
MRILGLDTTTSTASVALIEDGEISAEGTYPAAGSEGFALSRRQHANHSQIILPLIEDILGRRGLSLGELSGLAVSIGPGSFTGLRIGLSTVKGLAYGSGIPVVGISTLLANAARATQWRGLICSFLDARKNEVYASIFVNDGCNLSRLSEDQVASPRSVIEAVQSVAGSTDCLFVGDGAQVYKQLLSDKLGMQAHVPSAAALRSVASAVGRLSEKRFQRREVDTAATLMPLYLRSPEAELRLRDML